MSNMTLLSKEQIFGYDRLDIFKKENVKAAMTDFAILLGGFASNSVHASSGNDLEDRTGYYWTKSSDGAGGVRAVDYDGSRICRNPYRCHVAFRPASLYSDINQISTNVVSGSPSISEIEYGEYPQKAVTTKLNEVLEKEYCSYRLTKTEKVYTTDSRNRYDYSKAFEAQVHNEYKYNGKRYIRVKANPCIDYTKLSNGSIVSSGDYVWVEIEPIIWLVDEKTGIVVSKKLLFSGVRFDGKDKYDGDFECTEMKKFIDNYFSKEISVTNIKTVEDFTTEEEIDDYIASKLAEARKRLELLMKK